MSSTKQNFTIFFSWQSDTDQSKTKTFIINTLNQIRSDYSEKINIIIKEDMRDQLGSEEIVNHIIEGIESSDIFIADLTIVTNYKKEKNQKVKHTSNPNVLYELGYAAKALSWNHIICVANVDYGEIEDLPFDINHRSIIRFDSSIIDSKKSIFSNLKNAVIRHIEQFLDGKTTKRNQSFKIGSYDFGTKEITNGFTAINLVDSFNSFQEKYKNKSKEIYNELVSLNNSYDFYVDENDSSPSNAVFNISGFLYKQNELLPYKYSDSDKDNIVQLSKKYLDIDLDDSFFNLGDLKIQNVVIAGRQFPKGSNEALQKLTLLDKFHSELLFLEANSLIFEAINSYYFVPIAIKNITKRKDSNIELTISTDGFSCPSIENIFDVEKMSVLCDHAYKTKILESLLAQKEDSNISSAIEFPELFLNTIMNDQREVEPKEFVDDYLLEFLAPAKNGICKISVEKLRANESVWAPKYLIFNREDCGKKMTVNIKSDQSSGSFEEQVELKSY